ncbi:MAG: PLP-dependent aminotransferase family protein, partial [Chloroflexi bacterium]|nr:PLP-dependent aminotransferase family protein [Chloroflexota bacterium]
FQNPSGVTLTLERRKEIVEIAAVYNVPIIEDDPYGPLRYEGEELTPLFVLDQQRLGVRDEDPVEVGNVIFTESFSKTLAPGFRVAFVVGPVEVIHALTQAKQGVDLHTSSFTQMVATYAARDGFLQQHIDHLRGVYKARRDLMLRLMEEHFPAALKWNRPQGGLFIWVEMPEGFNTTDLLAKAVEQQVAFVPGAPFFANGGGENIFRLNFSNATEAQIETGIKRLAEVLKAELAPVG